jgi:hypothetical protein
MASTEQINQLIAAHTDLKIFWESQKDNWDGDVAAAQAAYNGLANNLGVVAQQQSFFTATLDPDEVAPTNVRGGVYNDLQTLLDDTSRFSKVNIGVVGGAEVLITDDIQIFNRNVQFTKEGAGARPKLIFVVNDDGVENYVPSLLLYNSASIQLVDVSTQLPTAKSDDALDWSSSRRAAIRGIGGTFFTVRMTSGFSLGGVSNALGVVSVNNSGIACVSIRDATINGAHDYVVDNNLGITLLSKSNITLVAGGGVNEGGTLGTNLLEV